jgi:hypothetical protein
VPRQRTDKRRLSSRGSVRTRRHGNWRQTYIDCGGVCTARIGERVCGSVDALELHEIFGENGHRNDPKFQIRILLCNKHHALVEDRTHNANLISACYRKSQLSQDVSMEIMLAGGYDKWVAKWKLDDSRCGCLLEKGSYVKA